MHVKQITWDLSSSVIRLHTCQCFWGYKRFNFFLLFFAQTKSILQSLRGISCRRIRLLWEGSHTEGSGSYERDLMPKDPALMRGISCRRIRLLWEGSHGEGSGSYERDLMPKNPALMRWISCQRIRLLWEGSHAEESGTYERVLTAKNSALMRGISCRRIRLLRECAEADCGCNVASRP
jgi:hypothetical protein